MKRGRPPGQKESETGSKCATYFAWVGMKQRCYNPNTQHWKDYGGRGITVCQKWRESYAAFLADVGVKPPGLWLDRIENNGNYEPGNVRWITPKESAANKRRRGGIPVDPLSLRQRAIAAGLPYHAVYFRINRLGWSMADALSKPLVHPGSHWQGGLLKK